MKFGQPCPLLYVHPVVVAFAVPAFAYSTVSPFTSVPARAGGPNTAFPVLNVASVQPETFTGSPTFVLLTVNSGEVDDGNVSVTKVPVASLCAVTPAHTAEVPI